MILQQNEKESTPKNEKESTSKKTTKDNMLEVNVSYICDKTADIDF